MEDPLTFPHPNALAQSCKEKIVCLCKHLKTLTTKWTNWYVGSWLSIKQIDKVICFEFFNLVWQFYHITSLTDGWRLINK
jgi:hypothetical protein